MKRKLVSKKELKTVYGTPIASRTLRDLRPPAYSLRGYSSGLAGWRGMRMK
jgi:hypothetical protein